MNVLKGLLALGSLCWAIAALRAGKIQEPGQASASELRLKEERLGRLIAVHREETVYAHPSAPTTVPNALK